MLTNRAKAFYLSLLVYILSFPVISNSADIIGPEVKIVNNEIRITSGLLADEKQSLDLKNGISKEITFYVDLFRVWNMWPDEFVIGKTIVKTLRSDPIKKENVATSFDGVTIIERRFNELDSMLKWALNITDLKLTSIAELEPDAYFIRITVESRIRKLPPVISYMFFFVPEKEFKIVKDSPTFNIGAVK